MDSVGENWVECQGLIDVLLDKAARWDERDDAATDLAGVEEPEALEALLRVGADGEEDETLLDTVGDAIAEIMRRHPDRESVAVERLAPAAQRAFKARASAERQ